MGYYSKTAAGYTIIEVLVALSILGVIFSTGFASFRDFSRRQLLASNVRALKGNLRLAQNYSLIGKKPSDIKCTGTNTLSGYQFKIESSNNEYVLSAGCSGGAVEDKRVTLPADISISISPALPNPIVFKVLGEGTNVAGSSVITLSQNITGNTATVTVTDSGEIK